MHYYYFLDLTKCGCLFLNAYAPGSNSDKNDYYWDQTFYIGSTKLSLHVERPSLSAEYLTPIHTISLLLSSGLGGWGNVLLKIQYTFVELHPYETMSRDMFIPRIKALFPQSLLLPVVPDTRDNSFFLLGESSIGNRWKWGPSFRRVVNHPELSSLEGRKILKVIKGSKPTEKELYTMLKSTNPPLNPLKR